MRRTYLPRAAVLLTAAALIGCGGGEVELPSPRPLVTHQGVRLDADPDELQEIHAWAKEAVEAVEEDPSFLLSHSTMPVPAYPWETLAFEVGDTVRIAWEQSAPDAQTSYWIYAFLHQMERMGRMGEWFPEAVGLEGFELERFIVARTAESWLLGRAVFDAHPYKLLDELSFAQEAGMLDAFILAARPDEFAEARERFEAEDPDGFERFRSWYRETFEGEPPGLRGEISRSAP